MVRPRHTPGNFRRPPAPVSSVLVKTPILLHINIFQSFYEVRRRKRERMITIESKPTTRAAVVAAIAVAATAIRTATRKLLRTAGAVVTVTKRHVSA